MKVRKYIPICTAVDAIVWDGHNTKQVSEFLEKTPKVVEGVYDNKYMIIKEMLDNPIVETIGNYIVKNQFGTVTVMNKLDFEHQYELVE